MFTGISEQDMNTHVCGSSGADVCGWFGFHVGSSVSVLFCVAVGFFVFICFGIFFLCLLPIFCLVLICNCPPVYRFSSSLFKNYL